MSRCFKKTAASRHVGDSDSKFREREAMKLQGQFLLQCIMKSHDR
jgi:hypothetical protein